MANLDLILDEWDCDMLLRATLSLHSIALGMDLKDEVGVLQRLRELIDAFQHLKENGGAQICDLPPDDG